MRITVLWWSRSAVPGYPVRETVIVNLLTEKAFRGILWERTPDHLVLKNAVLMAPRTSPVEMTGDVVIDRDQVEFLQVVSS